jgi:hypothetical protein
MVPQETCSIPTCAAQLDCHVAAGSRDTASPTSQIENGVIEEACNTCASALDRDGHVAAASSDACVGTTQRKNQDNGHNNVTQTQNQGTGHSNDVEGVDHIIKVQDEMNSVSRDPAATAPHVQGVDQDVKMQDEMSCDKLSTDQTVAGSQTVCIGTQEKELSVRPNIDREASMSCDKFSTDQTVAGSQTVCIGTREEELSVHAYSDREASQPQPPQNQNLRLGQDASTHVHNDREASQPPDWPERIEAARARYSAAFMRLVSR